MFPPTTTRRRGLRTGAEDFLGRLMQRKLA
jgi:hypothetical protein